MSKMLPLALLLCAFVAAEDMRPAHFSRGLNQPCHAETLKFCRDDLSADCLDQHKSEITNEACLTFIESRRVCNQDLSNNNLCPAGTTNLFRCLMDADASLLSEACKTSAYYQSAMTQKAIRDRFRQDGNVKDLGDAQP